MFSIDLRSGTMNVPSIVGFGAACEIISKSLNDDGRRVFELRKQLEIALLSQIPTILINGSEAERLPNTSSLTFPGVDADALILNCPEIMIGTGSACTSGTVEPSHVLLAIGLDRNQASSTIRVSLGSLTTNNDISKAIKVLSEAWIKLS